MSLPVVETTAVSCTTLHPARPALDLETEQSNYVHAHVTEPQTYPVALRLRPVKHTLPRALVPTSSNHYNIRDMSS
jgi:hypothetical protein